MRCLILVFLSIFLLSQNMNKAVADEGDKGKQELFFYLDTKIPQTNDVTLSLCYLTTTNSKFGINYWRSMDGYVLSPQKCVGYTYLKITPEQFAKARISQMIPSDTPEKPAMSWALFWGGFYGLILTGVLIIAAIFALLYRKKQST